MHSLIAVTVLCLTSLPAYKVVALLWRSLISLGYLPTALSSAVLGLSKFGHSGM